MKSRNRIRLAQDFLEPINIVDSFDSRRNLKFVLFRDTHTFVIKEHDRVPRAKRAKRSPND